MPRNDASASRAVTSTLVHVPAIRAQHRHALAATFALLIVTTLIGATVNGFDARGHVVDDLTDRGVKDARLQHGTRMVATDENGEFVFPSLPRTSQLQINASGYLSTKAPTTADEIRLSPQSVTIQVSEEGATEEARIKSPQARQGTKILSTGNESGQITISPHPGSDAVVLICAEGYESREIKIEGVRMQTTLKRGGTGCPPIPTPTPAPGASPSPSPAASPTRTPTGSP